MVWYHKCEEALHYRELRTNKCIFYTFGGSYLAIGTLAADFIMLYIINKKIGKERQCRTAICKLIVTYVKCQHNTSRYESHWEGILMLGKNEMMESMHSWI